MPRRLLLLGLPSSHGFTPILEGVFRSAIPPDQAYTVDVFLHDDPGQIRLLTVDFWLAARFANVVKTLHDKYKGAAAGSGNADTRYFCNIDPEGEEDRRPDLFLLDDEIMRLRYEAELWLGQQPDLGVVQVDLNGVILILEGRYGPSPETLGDNLAATIANPDRPRMDRLHQRLTEVLAGRDSSWLAGLLRQQRTEMQKQHGLNSREYQHWDRILTLLEPLVD